jgi:hypothetical protein
MIGDNQAAREQVTPEKTPDLTAAEYSAPVVKPKKSFGRLLGDVLDHGGPGLSAVRHHQYLQRPVFPDAVSFRLIATCCRS